MACDSLLIVLEKGVQALFTALTSINGDITRQWADVRRRPVGTKLLEQFLRFPCQNPAQENLFFFANVHLYSVR